MKKRVLAVDEDLLTLGFIRDALHAEGYEVTCVSGGQDAINILDDNRFDCVVLDFYMPDRDGLDIISSMYRKNVRIPTIIFSSDLSPHREAYVQGFGIIHEVLKKPCSAERLSDVVGKAVAKKTVLIVDDTALTRHDAVSAIRALGYQPVPARSAQAGLHILQTEHIDLAIINNEMALMTGLQMIDRMRALHDDTPVILITPMLPDMPDSTARRLNVSDYLNRDLHSDRAKRVIANALGDFTAV
ncbi:MAG: response regulator [Lachnospiraceae bacterium]|nr:response regulator [Lachnospiraceae bacterium]